MKKEFVQNFDQGISRKIAILVLYNIDELGARGVLKGIDSASVNNQQAANNLCF